MNAKHNLIVDADSAKQIEPHKHNGSDNKGSAATVDIVVSEGGQTKNDLPPLRSRAHLDAFDGFRILAHGIREMFASANLSAGIGAVALGVAWALTSWLALNVTSAYLISVGTGFVGAVAGSHLDKRRHTLLLPTLRNHEALLTGHQALPQVYPPCPRCTRDVDGTWLRGRCGACGFLGIPFTGQVLAVGHLPYDRIHLANKRIGVVNAYLYGHKNDFNIAVVYIGERHASFGERSLMSERDARSLLAELDHIDHDMVNRMMFIASDNHDQTQY